MPELEITRQSEWTGLDEPDRGLHAQLKVANGFKRDIDVRVLRVHATLKAGISPVVTWRPHDVRMDDPVIHAGSYNFYDLELPLGLAMIRRIEDARANVGTVGIDLNFTIRFTFRRPLDLFTTQIARSKMPSEEGEASMADSYLASDLQHPQHRTLSETIARDTWFDILNKMGWDELKLIEIPVRRIKQHERFAKALMCLDDARTAFRNGDYDGTVTKARKACETAAAIASEDEDITKKKEAFDALLQQAIPAPYDSDKRQVLSEVMLALAKLRHLGAHGFKLQPQVLRHDAEFGLSVAAAVFRYLGESISFAERLK